MTTPGVLNDDVIPALLHALIVTESALEVARHSPLTSGYSDLPAPLIEQAVSLLNTALTKAMWSRDHPEPNGVVECKRDVCEVHSTIGGVLAVPDDALSEWRKRYVGE